VGTSNTGNVASRFFENPKTTSEIAGLDEDSDFLLFYKQLLLVLLKKYARETAEYYVSLYDWYKMPVTVHRS
jgi:hypothetical protein